MRTTPFNLLDGAFLNLDTREEPWSVQVELRVSGRLDAERLSQAIWAMTETHPMARARLRPVRDIDTTYVWEIPDRIDHLPLEIVEVSDEAGLADARSRLQSMMVPLNNAPPFAISLVHCPGGDYLMLNASHIMADGLSTFRLITSIARHYAGEADPVPSFDPLSVRDLSRLAGARSLPERLKRATSLIEHLWESRKGLTRVKTKGFQRNSAQDGYGFVTLHFNAADSARVMARREKPATVNDMLLAGLMVSIRRWNEREGGETGRQSVMMPVNLRPQDWWYEVATNFSSYVPVALDSHEQTDFVTAMRAVCARTTQLKNEGSAGTLIDLLEIPRWLPAILKKRLRDVVPLFERTSVETAVLSNLGRLASPPSFGSAGMVTEIWFSPPGLMPMGTSVGAASMGDEMFLTLRYRRAQFDADAAREFAALYRETLLG